MMYTKNDWLPIHLVRLMVGCGIASFALIVTLVAFLYFRLSHESAHVQNGLHRLASVELALSELNSEGISLTEKLRQTRAVDQQLFVWVAKNRRQLAEVSAGISDPATIALVGQLNVLLADVGRVGSHTSALIGQQHQNDQLLTESTERIFVELQELGEAIRLADAKQNLALAVHLGQLRERERRSGDKPSDTQDQLSTLIRKSIKSRGLTPAVTEVRLITERLATTERLTELADLRDNRCVPPLSRLRESVLEIGWPTDLQAPILARIARLRELVLGASSEPATSAGAGATAPQGLFGRKARQLEFADRLVRQQRQLSNLMSQTTGLQAEFAASLSHRSAQSVEQAEAALGTVVAAIATIALAAGVAFTWISFVVIGKVVGQMRENHQSTLALQESQAELDGSRLFLRSILDSLDAAICIIDDKGEIIETNEAWKQLSPRQHANRRLQGIGANYITNCEYATGDGRDAALRMGAAARDVLTGARQRYVDEYGCSNGDQQQWFQVLMSPLKSATKRQAVVALLDITTRIRATEALERKSAELEKLALVAKYTDNAVIITDEQTRIEWVNEGFTRLTEYALEEVVGRRPGQFLQGGDTDPEVVATMRQALEKQIGFDVEVKNYNKSGRPYWVSIEARPIRDAEGRLRKYIAVESDISARREYEAERERLQVEIVEASRQAGMAELATGVLHNVGNVLNSVNVSTEIIQGRLRDSALTRLLQANRVVQQHTADWPEFAAHDPRGQMLPRLLDRLANRLQSEHDFFVAEMRSLSKNVDHIKQTITVQQSFAKVSGVQQDVDVAELLEDALRASGILGVTPEVEVTRQYDRVAEVTTDKHKLMQIVVNLLTNAKQAMSDSPSRQLRVELKAAEASDLLIRITDSGSGIAVEHLNRIFEHGFTTKEHGHGFGLHSCALTAHDLGGGMSVHSDGPGRGATFELRLPRSCQPAAGKGQTQAVGGPEPGSSGSFPLTVAAR